MVVRRVSVHPAGLGVPLLSSAGRAAAARAAHAGCPAGGPPSPALTARLVPALAEQLRDGYLRLRSSQPRPPRACARPAPQLALGLGLGGPVGRTCWHSAREDGQQAWHSMHRTGRSSEPPLSVRCRGFSLWTTLCRRTCPQRRRACCAASLWPAPSSGPRSQTSCSTPGAAWGFPQSMSASTPSCWRGPARRQAPRCVARWPPAVCRCCTALTSACEPPAVRPQHVCLHAPLQDSTPQPCV